jgi:PAS domain S-box-containing protein
VTQARHVEAVAPLVPALAVDVPRPHALEVRHSINQRIFDTSLDLILVVDRRGTFLRVSPSSLAILGYQPDEMIGRSAREFVHPDDLERTREDMRLARRGRLTRNFECRYCHKTGRAVMLAWKGIWSEPDAQYFFIGRDTTERVALENQLRQAQKMEAIGQLTGGIAHDFNNILTVIIGMNEMMSDAVASNPRLKDIAETIDEAATRGAQLTQRMLAFARKQPLNARHLNLNEFVERIATILRHTLGEDIAVKTVFADDLWPALADPSQVEDAILNLAVNARDAMPKGGQLVIETLNVHLDEHYAAQNVDVLPGDYVALTVTDSGTGMAPEVVERVFEPFFTTKEVGRGTGLGLSMVYGFIKQSHGHIKIYSEVGHGTSIKLYLPRALSAEERSTDSAPSTAAHAGGRETILVVEDSSAVRKVAVKMLRSLGYQVREAEDGRAALAVLQQPDAIDLLFTDLIMPNGIDGQELLVRARQQRPGLKALFTSGYSEHFLKARGDTDQSVPLLGKPYRSHKLAEAVRRVLDAPQAVDGALRGGL